MRIVFMGSSAASATCLQAILREKSLEVVGLVTQPDKPAGRGKEVTPCACKAYAVKRGITNVITPLNVNDPEPMAQIAAWKPDAVVVVAYGQFLKEPLLNLPKYGCINCHFSLLPKYRGASPVVACLEHGDMRTGVTVMKMGIGMDDGPILMQSYEPVYPDTTGGALMDDLAIAGGVTLAKCLKQMEAGILPPPMAQNNDDATYTHKLKKTDGLINWDEPVLVIERKIRAYYPWPGCYSFVGGKRLGILKASFADANLLHLSTSTWPNQKPGTVLAITKKGFVVKAHDTSLLITEVKPEGKNAMPASAFLNGRKLSVGDMLS